MTSSPSHTSLTLIRRVEANDREAWNLFTQLYGPLVFNWCRSTGMQQEDIEDVGQEVFRVVSLKLGTFEPGRKRTGAFRSWLWGITRLEILRYSRARQKQPAGTGGSDHNLWIQRLETEPEEPQSVSGVSAQRFLFQNAIGLIKTEFDPRTWKAFWEMAVAGRPAKEIGEEIGMAAKAVRQAKFRVTKKLRELLIDDFPVFAEIPSNPEG